MTRRITFNELRHIKVSLPQGGTAKIAEALGLTVETVRNYFGGHDYKSGQSCGIHIEQGPEGGLVVLDDTTILDMALQMIEESRS
jgi:predicted transcriptional regulator